MKQPPSRNISPYPLAIYGKSQATQSQFQFRFPHTLHARLYALCSIICKKTNYKSTWFGAIVYSESECLF
jgi:hypothetical protein